MTAALTLAALAGVFFAVTPTAPDAAPARAATSSDCASPTRTLSPGPASISVSSGEVVLLSGGDFTGGVDSLPSGATLCIDGSASLTTPYMNNAAGTIVVAPHGEIALPNVAVNAGFDLELSGIGTVAGLNVNGDATIHVADGGRLTASSALAISAGVLDVDGEFIAEQGLTLDSASTLDNSGTITVKKGLIANGDLSNTGTIDVGGGFTQNSAAFANSCIMSVGGDFMNDSDDANNAGIVTVSGQLTNNGSWHQPRTGVLIAAALVDDQSITGYGRYVFSGTTSVQGSFSGDDAEAPILVDTSAAPDAIFDIENGKVENVDRVDLDADAISNEPVIGCEGAPLPTTTDVAVTKAGPRYSLDGASVSYTITISNRSDATAEGVVAQDAIPTPGFTPTDLDGGSPATVDGAGVVRWTIGTLDSGASVSRTLTGVVTGIAGTELEDTVTITTTTPDSVSMNDTASVSTRIIEIGQLFPHNVRPDAQDLVKDGITGRPVLGRVVASDVNSAQTLRFTAATMPDHGRVVMAGGGRFAYISARDFTGIDTFTYEVCDNGILSVEGVLCDTGTVTVNIRPIARDDLATTSAATPVEIPLLTNDTRGTAAPTDLTSPAHGAVIAGAAGRVTYTPEAGYLGDDTFEYTICSPTAPTLCDTAEVLVSVIARNDPPTVNSAHLVIRLDGTASAPYTLEASDPNGDEVTTTVGTAPVHGAVTPNSTGYLYTPEQGYIGRDIFTVITCDDGVPVLCATGLVEVDVYPVAIADSATTVAPDSVTITVTVNDLGAGTPATGGPTASGDEGAAAAATSTGGATPDRVSDPAHGSVVVAGDDYVYTPDDGFAGVDVFEYRICSQSAAPLCSDPTTVTITVTDQSVTPPVPTPTPTPTPDTPTPNPSDPATPGSSSTAGGTGTGLASTGVDPGAGVVGALAALMAGWLLVRVGIRRRRHS